MAFQCNLNFPGRTAVFLAEILGSYLGSLFILAYYGKTVFVTICSLCHHIWRFMLLVPQTSIPYLLSSLKDVSKFFFFQFCLFILLAKTTSTRSLGNNWFCNLAFSLKLWHFSVQIHKQLIVYWNHYSQFNSAVFNLTINGFH